MEPASQQSRSIGGPARGPQSLADPVEIRSDVHVAHLESESDTDSVFDMPWEESSQRRRFVLMSSRTVAAAPDSPDSHEDRFQRVRRAMQARPVAEVEDEVPDPVVEDGGFSASGEQSSQASPRSLPGQRHCRPHF